MKMLLLRIVWLHFLILRFEVKLKLLILHFLFSLKQKHLASKSKKIPKHHFKRVLELIMMVVCIFIFLPQYTITYVTKIKKARE